MLCKLTNINFGSGKLNKYIIFISFSYLGSNKKKTKEKKNKILYQSAGVVQFNQDI
jgi:hypothetical protein